MKEGIFFERQWENMHRENKLYLEKHDDDSYVETGVKGIGRRGMATRKGEEKEAMSWQGITLSSCMLGKLFGTQR